LNRKYDQSRYRTSKILTEMTRTTLITSTYQKLPSSTIKTNLTCRITSNHKHTQTIKTSLGIIPHFSNPSFFHQPITSLCLLQKNSLSKFSKIIRDSINSPHHSLDSPILFRFPHTLEASLGHRIDRHFWTPKLLFHLQILWHRFLKAN